MCGIAGYIGRKQGSADERATAMAEAMCLSVAHRGPDDAGVWVSDDGGVVLGHRRLSVIDLSPLGRNPMPWDGGRLHITYNGEVYNYRELRAELEEHGCRFRSQTDTEVILASYDRWGLDCLNRFVGMFAFAIWDEARRRLFMARDRLGKKPLYYTLGHGGLSFASELKALAVDPAFSRTPDPAAVSLYLRYGYVPAPYSIFLAARKLPPAHYAVYERGELRVDRYWDPVAVALSGPEAMSEAEADGRLEHLLVDAVRSRMIADVPIGAFLSGGIDSSLVVALMQEVGSSRARTFTIRFANPEYDESAHAAGIARHLGTEHHEEPCGLGEMLDVVNRLPAFFDEPFADSSAIPTYLVSRAARRHVTVALSGDGGDELFFGYPRYFFANRGRWLLKAPRLVRHAAARLAASSPGRRMQRAAGILAQDDADPYARFVSWWSHSDMVRLGTRVCDFPAYVTARERVAALEPRARPPLLDLVSYLPEDILTKVDRASMAASLETRCPLLDHRVVEFALKLPLALRANDRAGKLPLRRLLDRRVPRSLTDRPKMGFGVPIADWLRGPLRGRMAFYVEGPLLPALGLDPTPARLHWHDFLAGRGHRADTLWNVFALAAWAEHWKPERSDPRERPEATMAAG
jgi:asparagine synthase (glutamine-hydrolysing)